MGLDAVLRFFPPRSERKENRSFTTGSCEWSLPWMGFVPWNEEAFDKVMAQATNYKSHM